MDFNQTYGMSFAEFVLHFAAYQRGVAKIEVIEEESDSFSQSFLKMNQELYDKRGWSDLEWQIFFAEQDKQAVLSHDLQLQVRLKNIRRILQFKRECLNWEAPELYRGLKATLEATLTDILEENLRAGSLELDVRPLSERKRDHLNLLEMAMQSAKRNADWQRSEFGRANVYAKGLLLSLGLPVPGSPPAGELEAMTELKSPPPE